MSESLFENGSRQGDEADDGAVWTGNPSRHLGGYHAGRHSQTGSKAGGTLIAAGGWGTVLP